MRWSGLLPCFPAESQTSPSPREVGEGGILWVTRLRQMGCRSCGRQVARHDELSVGRGLRLRMHSAAGPAGDLIAPCLRLLGVRVRRAASEAAAFQCGKIL